MKVSLTDAGKRFNRDWIFRHCSYEFAAEQSYAIIGPNGAGKSTLLQTLSGSMLLSEGNGKWIIDIKEIASDKIFNYVSICAPYLELVEEMSLNEFLNFHHGFKPFLPGLSIENIISILGLDRAATKQIRYFSSGMKQRVKLAQAIFSDTPVVLLDEPCTNFDKAGYELYYRLINDYCKKRMVIVSSNDPHEYEFCTHQLNIQDWK